MLRPSLPLRRVPRRGPGPPHGTGNQNDLWPLCQRTAVQQWKALHQLWKHDDERCAHQPLGGRTGMQEQNQNEQKWSTKVCQHQQNSFKEGSRWKEVAGEEEHYRLNLWKDIIWYMISMKFFVDFPQINHVVMIIQSDERVRVRNVCFLKSRHFMWLNFCETKSGSNLQNKLKNNYLEHFTFTEKCLCPPSFHAFKYLTLCCLNSWKLITLLCLMHVLEWPC